MFRCNAPGCEEKFDDRNSHEYLVHSSYHDYHEKIRLAGQEELVHLEIKLNASIRCPLEDHLEGSFYFPQLPSKLICHWDNCTTQFFSAKDYYSHVADHAHRLVDKCYWEGCDKVFKTITLSILREHLRVHTLQKLYACPRCGNFFSTKIKFDDHFLRHFKLSDLLNGRQMTPEKITHHEKDVKFDIEEYEVGSKFGRVRVFRCTHGNCAETFLTSSLLREHIRIHSDKYQCDQCQFVAKSGSQLDSHKLYRHTEVRNFKCRLCPKAFKQKGDLRAHIKRHQIKPFQCEECEFITSSEEGFSKHIKLHSRTSDYRCHVCGGLFSRGNNLSRHLKVQHQLVPPKGLSRFKFIITDQGSFQADMGEERTATDSNANNLEKGADINEEISSI